MNGEGEKYQKMPSTILKKKNIEKIRSQKEEADQYTDVAIGKLLKQKKLEKAEKGLTKQKKKAIRRVKGRKRRRAQLK